MLIRIATTLNEIENAWRLVYQQYNRVNFIPENPAQLWTYPQNISKNNLTLCGFDAGELVATCSAVIDSELKLPLDNYFADELDEMRSKGKKMMEIGLLTDKRPDAKLSKLVNIHATLSAFGLHTGHTDLIIGVNPRGFRHYSSLGFKIIGDSKSYDTLQNAPVILLHTSMDEETPINQKMIPLVKSLSRPYDLETRYTFPSYELMNSTIEKFTNTQELAYAHAM